MRLKRKLIPYVCFILMIGIFSCIYIIGTIIVQYLPKVDDNNNYQVIDIINEETIPVNSELKVKIIKPYDDSNVSIVKHFYDINGDATIQENSIIYFKDTYLQNTGVYYKSESIFNVISILDGEIQLITEDELLGNIIEIVHQNNLVSVYQSVDNIKYQVGEKVKQGDIICTSGINKIENYSHNLLFELYQDGNILNPEKMFDTFIE